MPSDKIRRLYESELREMVNEVLLDVVVIGFYLRCRSVASASSAWSEKAECPRYETVIIRQSSIHDELLCCP